MAQQYAKNRYVDDGAGVVPQPRLLVMLYDRLVLDLEQADAAFGGKQYEIINDKLTHAQAIILALRSALDVDAWEGGRNLAELYAWFNDELVQANVHKDVRRMRVCLHMIRDLQDAWHKAYETVLAERENATATSAGASANAGASTTTRTTGTNGATTGAAGTAAAASTGASAGTVYSG